LFIGHILPTSVGRHITGWGLRTHIEGITYYELHEATLSYENADQKDVAAILRLGLVRLDAEQNKFNDASLHAARSQELVPSEDAILALALLNLHNGEIGKHWISELQAIYPENELSQMTLCVSQLQSFENAIPLSCQKVGWLSEKSSAGRQLFINLANEIRDLPAEAKKQIKKAEDEIAKENSELRSDRADLEEIDRDKRDVIADALGNAVINLLPLPLPGDDLEKFVAREGLCLFPVIRWICALIATGGPAVEANARLKTLDEYRAVVSRLIELREKSIDDSNKNIRYWKSNGPLNKLLKAKAEVLPTFLNDVNKVSHAKREKAGLSIHDAVEMANR